MRDLVLAGSATSWRLMILQIALVLAVCSLPAATEAVVRDATALPRVYIFTAEAKSGGVTDEEQGRLDSVRDLRDALAKKRNVVLVPDAGGADILVEVVGREKRDVPAGGFGGTVITKPVETIVRLHVRYGSRDADIKGVGQATWSRAAKDAAERLVKWIARGPGSL
jgi:hypothetical protein